MKGEIASKDRKISGLLLELRRVMNKQENSKSFKIYTTALIVNNTSPNSSAKQKRLEIREKKRKEKVIVCKLEKNYLEIY